MGNGLNGTSAAGASANGVGPAVTPHDDQQMDQIRDLLFGGLRAEMLARLDGLERRIATLEAGLAEARRLDDAKRQTAFDGLSTAVATLATQIRTLTKA